MPLGVTAIGDEQSRAILLAVGGLLGREIAIGDLLQGLVDRIREVIDADRGTIYLVDRAKAEVFSKAAHLPELPEIRLALGQGIAGWVAKTGEVVNLPVAHTEARFFAGVDERTGYQTRSMLAVPMRGTGGAIIGVVQLLNKKSGVFSDADAQRLSALAQQAALAIEATTLFQELTQRERGTGAEPLPLSDRFNRIVGESEPLRQACRLTSKAAASHATVLIRGESGTGKELFARAVHVNSPRREGPLVKVDCAALPATLIENELFGHERGAFTSADQRTLGKIDAAQGGTLFLDEIGELPLSVQGKLLRVLQDREFERVGGDRPIKADVRIVAATNRNLEKMVTEGLFRSDLYYRIRVVEIALPSLRTRGRGDILRLAKHFLAAAARRHGRAIPHLSEAAAERLATYAWPGNVRELENCLESAVVIMDGDEVLPDHLPLPTRGASLAPPAQLTARGATPKEPPGDARFRTLLEVEREHVLRALEAAGGNQSQAAKLLGIGRNTLARKLRDLKGE
ncbi:MAG: sigma 54-interacting transcriptional regulator [Deltaproteobacteria bacterium]|nr:sigma 54-interacting transcriptional regulator [Deltaproteobacteria bacterium]